MVSEHDLAEQLLRLARDDEAAARAMLDVGAVTDAIVGFHAQQEVEKALKAVLAFHGVEVPFTHDLAGLADRCAAEGASLPSSLAEIDRLTPFGVRLRYGSSMIWCPWLGAWLSAGPSGRLPGPRDVLDGAN